MPECNARCRESQESSCEEAKKCCACGTSCGGDPVACAAAIWKGSFFQAMKELQVEALKPKIKKALGEKIDKASDATLESMFAVWRSMIAKSGVQQDFLDRLAAIFKEGK